MRFRCPGCEVTFSVPDEKIPDGKGVRVLCPKCRTPIDLKDTIQSDDAMVSPENAFSPPNRDLLDVQEEMALLDMVDEGVKTALVCSTDVSRLEMIRTAVSQLGFFVVEAEHASYAMKKFQNNRYDLVVLDECFDAPKTSDNLFLHHMQLLPMHMRRQFFLCLLSESMTSLDQMVAFRIGVDMIINVRDLDKMKIILIRGINDHKALYKLFGDELSKKGSS